MRSASLAMWRISALITPKSMATTIPALQQRSFSNDDDTMFYNSQAGRWMLKPGALGLRVHELYTLVSGPPGLRAMQPAKLSSYQWKLSTLGEGISEAPQGGGGSMLHLVVPVETPEDVHAVASASAPAGGGSPRGAATTAALSTPKEGGSRGGSTVPPAPIVIQPQVTLQLTPEVDQDALNAAKALVKQCAKAGLSPRVLLTHAWAPSEDDLDENLHADSLYEVVLALADDGAAVITLSECLGGWGGRRRAV